MFQVVKKKENYTIYEVKNFLPIQKGFLYIDGPITLRRFSFSMSKLSWCKDTPSFSSVTLAKLLKQYCMNKSLIDLNFLFEKGPMVQWSWTINTWYIVYIYNRYDVTGNFNEIPKIKSSLKQCNVSCTDCYCIDGIHYYILKSTQYKRLIQLSYGCQVNAARAGPAAKT